MQGRTGVTNLRNTEALALCVHAPVPSQLAQPLLRHRSCKRGAARSRVTQLRQYKLTACMYPTTMSAFATAPLHCLSRNRTLCLVPARHVCPSCTSLAASSVRACSDLPGTRPTSAYGTLAVSSQRTPVRCSLVPTVTASWPSTAPLSSTPILPNSAQNNPTLPNLV